MYIISLSIFQKARTKCHLIHSTASFEISEQNLIKDLVFVLQGIDGQWVKYDPVKLMYKVDQEVRHDTHFKYIFRYKD